MSPAEAAAADAADAAYAADAADAPRSVEAYARERLAALVVARQESAADLVRRMCAIEADA